MSKPTITLQGNAQLGSMVTYKIGFSPVNSTSTTSSMVVGDVNGDGVVNCADLAIVKAAFGKKLGQVGYDPRADVNGDGVVNALDLATVSQHIPAGTKCP